MNLPPDHRQLQQTQQQKQKTLIIKKTENILDFNSRLIEALVAASKATVSATGPNRDAQY
jgi:hypothetical protein